jgi:crotonobetainyl-CoA:carnitine CoA-transferase CaiB-like acyl-CoA transferase
VHISESTFEDKTAPELGEDTYAVLEEAGFTKKEIKGFKSDGII